MTAGCPSGPERDPFGVFAIGIDDVPTDDLVVRSLQVSVGEVVLEATGPSGEPESIAVLVDHVFEPLLAVDAVGFDLEQGRHTDVRLEIAVRADDGPGLRLEGAAGEASGETSSEETSSEETSSEETSSEETSGEETEDPEAGKISIAVDEIVLGFRVPRIAVGEEALIGRVRFDPQGWLEALDADDGGLVIDPDSPRYPALLDAIAATTEFTFDSGPGRDHDDEGDE